MVALTLALVACTGQVDDTAPARETAEPAVEDTASIFPVLALERTPEELVEGVGWLLEHGYPEPNALIDLYLAQMAEGDDACPGSATFLTGLVLGCTAATGWHYEGISTYADIEQEGEVVGRSFTGEFRIIDPEGAIFTAAGDTHFIHTGSAGGNSWTAWLSGSWHVDGDDGWLGRGVSASIDYYREQGILSVDGVLQAGDVAVDFESLVYEVDGRDGPEGSIVIRDPSGLWVTWTTTGGGCGTLELDGELLGEDLCTELDAPMQALLDAVPA